MPTIVGFARTSQEQILGAVTTVQDTVADGYAKWTSIVSEALPKNLPTFPTVPFVPQPAEVVELGFGFVDKFLGLQRSFADKLLVTGVPAPVAPAVAV